MSLNSKLAIPEKKAFGLPFELESARALFTLAGGWR
jgi:hypothetical protein